MEKQKSMLVDPELKKSSPNLIDVMEMLTVVREVNKKQYNNMCNENIEDLKHRYNWNTNGSN